MIKSGASGIYPNVSERRVVGRVCNNVHSRAFADRC